MLHLPLGAQIVGVRNCEEDVMAFELMVTHPDLPMVETDDPNRVIDRSIIPVAIPQFRTHPPIEFLTWGVLCETD